MNEDTPTNFIRKRIEADVAAGAHGGQVVTRFPPEPNGYLHIGHAKSICLNFGLARDFGGRCNLRFDDTNPAKESAEHVAAIEDDVRWLGFEWARLCHASDYFEQLFDYALQLIRQGDAYVCDLDGDSLRARRGTLTEPGQNSPHRDRGVDESLALFERMRAGEFAAGARTLRAKIDMAAPNMCMRDPVIYRILDATHYRRGDAWRVYPTYDFAHCLSDSIEGVTHSLCTLEFEDNRALYDWYLERLGVFHPQQIEFARLNLKYTQTSKRRLKKLVDDGVVSGWDDPRMPTLRGLRRRGFPAAAIRDFCARIGVTKNDSLVEMDLLETCVREHLDRHAPRAFAVLRPLKVTVENLDPGETLWVEAPNHPKDPAAGARQLAFTRTLYIERDDFMEDPPKQFFRLAPGRETRFKYAFYLTCREAVKNAAGEVVELRCTYDPATLGGRSDDGRKVRGTIHWLSAEHAAPCKMRLYDRLFRAEQPGDEPADLNPDSLAALDGCFVEAHTLRPEVAWQFERGGYFCLDSAEPATFNRTLTLRDSWAKIAAAR